MNQLEEARLDLARTAMHALILRDKGDSESNVGSAKAIANQAVDIANAVLHEIEMEMQKQ